MLHHSAAGDNDLRLKGRDQQDETAAEEIIELCVVPTIAHPLIFFFPRLRIFELL